MSSKILDGYILGVDKKKMYSIISDGIKSYQLDCEYDLLGLNQEDIIAERKFKMIVDNNDEVSFEFLDEYINDNITVQDLKDLKDIT